VFIEFRPCGRSVGFWKFLYAEFLHIAYDKGVD